MLDGGFGDWFLAYAMGYKMAADAAVDAVRAREATADLAGYAVLYLYRHYVEVMLKGLISQGQRLFGNGAAYPNYPTNTHDIEKLWKQCRPLLEKAFPEDKKADTDAVEKCMGEFATLDPGDPGETFRYGEDKFGRRTITKALYVDLENLRDVMEGISGFFEGGYDRAW